MDLKSELTNEEYNAVMNTLPAAAAYVGLASGGAFGFIREMLASGRYLEAAVKEGTSGYGAIVTEITEAMKNMTREDAQALALEFEPGDQTAARERAKQVVAQGWAAIKGLPGADGFARWVVDGARAAAQARTGGFLGFGAKAEVDPEEQAALDELAALMSA